MLQSENWLNQMALALSAPVYSPPTQHPGSPELSQPARTIMSCRFKRQIKLFEKLYTQKRVREHLSFQQPATGEDEERPTFFFGDEARSQLV